MYATTVNKVLHLRTSGFPESDLGEYLLRLLRPTDPSIVDKMVLDTRLLDEVATRTGPCAAAWAIEASRQLMIDLSDEPFLGKNAQSPSDNGFFEAVSLWAVLRLSGVEVLPRFLVRELGRVIRDRVPLGVSVDAALRCLRFAHAAVTRMLFEFCAFELPGDHQAAVMSKVSTDLFDGMETLAAAITHDFIMERDRWLAGSAAERAEFVHSILNGENVNTRTATRRLGYDLTLHHIALVLWSDENTHCARELETTALRLLEQAGCSSMLLLPAGSSRLWAWGGRAVDQPTELGRLEMSPAGTGNVRVAGGLPGDGVAGFRRSHDQATTVERISRDLTPKSGNLHDYGALELLVLLGSDLNGAAEFVRRELRGLITDDRSTAAVRETLKCYLDQEHSIVSTAELLHVARNTVVYRVKKAEKLRGRPCREDRLQLHMALYLVEQLGPAVLRPQSTDRLAIVRPGPVAAVGTHRTAR